MSEGPAAGLVIFDALAHHPQLTEWPQLYLARADLLRRLELFDEAIDAYQLVLQLEPSEPERRFIGRRLTELLPRSRGAQEAKCFYTSSTPQAGTSWSAVVRTETSNARTPC